MNNEFIRFDEKKIAEIAGLLVQQNNHITEITETVSNTNDDLKRLWLGQAANEYSKKLDTIVDRISLIRSSLSELSDDLFKAAGLYDQAQAQAKVKIDGLPVNGVFK